MSAGWYIRGSPALQRARPGQWMGEGWSEMSNDKPTMQVPSSVPLPKIRKGGRNFWRETMREMKHVHWPSRHETNRLTGVVLGVCGLTVGFLFALSYVFETLLKIVYGGAK